MSQDSFYKQRLPAKIPSNDQPILVVQQVENQQPAHQVCRPVVHPYISQRSPFGLLRNRVPNFEFRSARRGLFDLPLQSTPAHYIHKTMLAKRLPTILPPLTLHEALETTKIHSVAGKLPENATIVSKRPFRSPHHTASSVALVGGGSYPQPGEISLAHNGVLFLDELPEFKREVLEVMRQPLEDREVTISRAKFTITYPSSFMLVASMNPSPSGYFNDPDSPVTSSPNEMQRYLSKISGPLLDRIDIHIEVTPVPFEKLTEKRNGESSVEIRKRVTAAREIQTERFELFDNIHYNAQMSSKQIREHCALDDDSLQLLKTAMERLNLSARAFDRILKVSRTIADLEGTEKVVSSHIAEAIQYRSLDREGWLG